MVEKRCATCVFYRIQGDTYFSQEYCNLHKISQNSPTGYLKVCEDWTESRYNGFKKAVSVLRGLW